MDFSILLFMLFLALVVFSITFIVIRNKKKRFLFSLTVTVILTPVIYFSIVVGLVYLIHIEKNREFDQDIWKESKAGSKMIKYEMIDNLVKNELIINKDSAEVKSILGEPEYKNYKSNYWQYYAGMGNGFGFVEHLLIVRFRNNKVFQVEHKRRKD